MIENLQNKTALQEEIKEILFKNDSELQSTIHDPPPKYKKNPSLIKSNHTSVVIPHEEKSLEAVEEDIPIEELSSQQKKEIAINIFANILSNPHRPIGLTALMELIYHMIKKMTSLEIEKLIPKFRDESEEEYNIRLDEEVNNIAGKHLKQIKIRNILEKFESFYPRPPAYKERKNPTPPSYDESSKEEKSSSLVSCFNFFKKKDKEASKRNFFRR